MAVFGTAGRVFGGKAVDRTVFRRLLPDNRWYVYAAGLVDPKDANTATLSLLYHKDDNTTVALGQTTKSGAGKQKWTMGPFDVFGTAGVPAGETVPIIYLKAQKNAGVDGELHVADLWVRYLPSRQ